MENALFESPAAKQSLAAIRAAVGYQSKKRRH
jgi:hypothetical protein